MARKIENQCNSNSSQKQKLLNCVAANALFFTDDRKEGNKIKKINIILTRSFGNITHLAASTEEWRMLQKINGLHLYLIYIFLNSNKNNNV